MTRLTRKFKTNYYFNTDNRDIVEKDIENDFYAAQAMRNKLGELEDIEEELGISLVILAKGMKNGIYVKQGKKILKKELKDIRYSKGLTVHYELNGKQYGKTGAIMILYGDYNSQYCDFNNVYTYGRDWALTKEELE